MINSVKINNINGLTTTNKLVKFERVTLLVGKNGAGKSRFLNLISDQFNGTNNGGGLEINLDEGEFNTYKNKYTIANYSHYDILLQSPESFIPDVIAGAHTRLNDYNYENTATDALLFIYDMAFRYSDYCKEHNNIFTMFKKHAEQFELKIDVEGSKLLICDNDGDDNKPLSPGQRYLLRMAVASFRKQLANQYKFSGSNIEHTPYSEAKYIFLIDEPEIHLHPDALINVMDILVENFEDDVQFIIATHSLALVSHFIVSAAVAASAKILWFEKGQISDFRSDSTKLIDGLIGDVNNRLAINNLISLPDDFACNIFAIQCINEPKPVSFENSDKQDGTSRLATETITPDSIILDYGVGKGRFLESLKNFEKDKLASIDYYAYDKFPNDSEICKKIMKECFDHSIEYDIDKHYTNNFKEYIEFFKSINGVDTAFMINVLHEIPVNEWIKTFENIYKILKDNGRLVIVEREELTVGEAPYVNGYVMLTAEGAKTLFGDHVDIKRLEDMDSKTNSKSVGENKATDKKINTSRSPIIRYVINKSGLTNLNKSKIKECLEQMKEEAKEMICFIHENHRKQANVAPKSKAKERNWRFKNGLRLAFWTHQFSNVTINLDNKYLAKLPYNRDKLYFYGDE